MQFYIVDAFSKELFGGNTAGVVFVGDGEPFPDEDRMMKTARELRYSETAFVKRLTPNRFHIRYFTPTDEVDLCGHATIGAFGALMDSGLVSANSAYEIETKVGVLAINTENELVFMDMSPPREVATIAQIEQQDQLARIMGITIADIGMAPKIISAGLPDIILHVKSKERLMGMQPDFHALSSVSREYGVVGVHAFTLLDEEGAVAYCRNFAPLYDINEEAATGTANAALTYYLFQNKIIDANSVHTFLQGESMKRPSEIFTSLTLHDSTPHIRVGGAFRVLARGELLL